MITKVANKGITKQRHLPTHTLAFGEIEPYTSENISYFLKDPDIKNNYTKRLLCENINKCDPSTNNGLLKKKINFNLFHLKSEID